MESFDPTEDAKDYTYWLFKVARDEARKKAEDCAKRARFRHERTMAAKGRRAAQFDNNFLAHELHRLALEVAADRGYLRLDTEDGVELICDGTDFEILPVKAAFVEALRDELGEKFFK